MKKLGLGLVFTLILSGCQTADTPRTASEIKPASLDNGKPLPQFEVPRLTGGTLKSSDLRGKVTVVDFWATWCNPCIAEIPNYNKLKEKFAGKDVEILGMTVESGSLEDIKPKVEEFKIQYSVVVGTDEIAQDFGGIIGWPTTFLVSKDGKIVKRIIGSPPGKIEQMEKDIEMLLGRSPQ